MLYPRMFWPWEIIERDHEIQNPLTPAKIRLLGDYLRLTSGSRLLDIACGKCGPAAILAETYGCRILGIEKNPGFADEARARLAARGLDALVEVQTTDASAVHLEPRSFDAALCLGASFVWGTMVEAAPALYDAVRPAGFAAIGEPFWHEWPRPRCQARGLRRPGRDRPPLRAGRLRAHGDHRLLSGRVGSLREPPLAGNRGVARRASGPRGRRRHAGAARALSPRVPDGEPRAHGLGDLRRPQELRPATAPDPRSGGLRSTAVCVMTRLIESNRVVRHATSARE